MTSRSRWRIAFLCHADSAPRKHVWRGLGEASLIVVSLREYSNETFEKRTGKRNATR